MKKLLHIQPVVSHPCIKAILFLVTDSVNCGIGSEQGIKKWMQYGEYYLMCFFNWLFSFNELSFLYKCYFIRIIIENKISQIK